MTMTLPTVASELTDDWKRTFALAREYDHLSELSEPSLKDKGRMTEVLVETSMSHENLLEYAHHFRIYFDPGEGM